MTAPPGLTPTPEPRVEQISAESDTDFSTRTKQMRYLVAELGVSRRQAHALIRAFEADQADARRIGNDTGRSDEAFIDWLMRQSPAHRNRPTRKWRVGEGGGWAVRS